MPYFPRELHHRVFKTQPMESRGGGGGCGGRSGLVAVGQMRLFRCCRDAVSSPLGQLILKNKHSYLREIRSRGRSARSAPLPRYHVHKYHFISFSLYSFSVFCRKPCDWRRQHRLVRLLNTSFSRNSWRLKRHHASHDGWGGGLNPREHPRGLGPHVNLRNKRIWSAGLLEHSSNAEATMGCL